jgi:hypothetical protein
MGMPLVALSIKLATTVTEEALFPEEEVPRQVQRCPQIRLCSRKRNLLSRYRQLTDLIRDPNEDISEVARVDRCREFLRR